MARMSIDDMFLRDPRVLRLGRACGWNKFETRGRLLEVFALVYDRVDAGADDVVQVADIDTAADHEGLAVLMIEHGLAEKDRRGVRIRGARERTNYLATRKGSGQLGGIKSGESRRKKAKVDTKVTFAKPEGRANPTPTPTPVPAVVLSGDAPAPKAWDPNEAGARGRLAEQTWKRLSEIRVAVARELGIAGVEPLTVITPGTEVRGFRDLRERIREEGTDAPRVCARVLESITARARESRSVEWVSEKATTEGAWRTAKERIPKWIDAQRAPSTSDAPKTYTSIMRGASGVMLRVTEDASGNVISTEPVLEASA